MGDCICPSVTPEFDKRMKMPEHCEPPGNILTEIYHFCQLHINEGENIQPSVVHKDMGRHVLNIDMIYT